MNLILKKLLVKMKICRQRAILKIDASDKSLPRLLICASDRERERSLASKMKPCGGVYLHDVVIHEQNFVDPLHPEIHTQNVENMWMRAKRKLRRQFSMPRPLFVTYLEEFLWMQEHRNRQRRLLSLLVCIRDQYQ